MKEHLDSETISNISNIPSDMWESWGRDGLWNIPDDSYKTKTVVESGQDAHDAFDKYRFYFEFVLEEWSPTSDTVVFVPCGSSKPIGSSTIHQKKVQAIRDGGLTDADIIVVSEPCTVVPPEYRLSLPAVNYDFPPEYTEKSSHPEVFSEFTDRLAVWIDEMDYTTVYSYLISGHQNKLTAAMEKSSASPTMYTIPSASYNPDTESYSGDRFKKQVDMTQKVKAVLKHKAGESSVTVAEPYDEFFESRWN